MKKYQQKKIAKQYFRAYDIRGIVDERFDENAFYSLGKAISYRMQGMDRKGIFIARDGRLTSDALSRALRQGLLDSGINVFDLGVVPTPVMYFATNVNDIDCGLMVTGSHNPAQYNGLKMVLAGKTLVNSDIEGLYAINQDLLSISGEGQYHTFDVIPQYESRILKELDCRRKLKVVVDSGNGMASVLAPRLISQLGCEVIPLYCEIDGRFPNHHPDPTVESNMRDLKAAVIEHQADLGLAFDGDADRIGVITNQGELIWPDRLMMLYSREVLKSNPGASIVFDVKCSSHLEQYILSQGGVPRMCPTGHSIVKGIMKEENAALAGEMSGHIFFKDRRYGFDDAIYSACRLIEILSQSSLSVSDQFKSIPNSINTPEIKIPISDETKFMFMKRLCEQAMFPDARLIDIDGLRVEFKEGWGLIRASNTTPCLVARFEAEDELSLTHIQTLFRTQLIALDNQLEIPF